MAKRKRQKNKFFSVWRRFAFKHTVSAIIGVSVFIMLLDTAIVQAVLHNITGLGYAGVFLTGILFVSFFTVVPATVLLLAFAQIFNPFIVAVIAACGAMIGDYIILKFTEDKIAHELKPVAKRLKLISFINLLHKRRYKPITATIGAIIVASPLPDEAGIALLGLSRMPTYLLLAVTLVMNCAGIMALIIGFG